jgi:cytochrome bd-type quinol oxidase subunit 2
MQKKHSNKHKAVRRPQSNHFWLSLLICIILCAYWILGINLQELDYHYPMLARIYELLWLPMIIGVACLPVYLLIHLSKDRFRLKSVFWIPIFLLIVSGIVILIYK